ncbi:hypothetical protein [Desulfitobacterium sp.]|uniref:hypothetical protein n=1 Tax=Desulfitobacterium sp. TaxID=49981 RepID=UPI002B2129C5|nr:hypothetical protein [Desulfitobacterium sp.]MEA4902627.1 hypothetical protein [Desulfitobacterium sp.]
MGLWELWAHGTTLGGQPFAYFAPMVSIIAFIVIVYIITALKQVVDNKEQHLLW